MVCVPDAASAMYSRYTTRVARPRGHYLRVTQGSPFDRLRANPGLG